MPSHLLLVVPDPMKLGDWVVWSNGSRAGEVTWLEAKVVHVRIITHHPNKLSSTFYTLPYPSEELTVIPEAIAKIINS